MNATNEDRLLAQAFAAHQAGRADEAEQAYKSVLAGNPCHAEALDGYAVLAFQTERLEIAADLAARATGADRRNPEYQYHHGLILKALNQFDASEESLRRTIKLAPNHAEACFNLGMMLVDQARADEGMRLVRKAAQLAPQDPDAQNGLALALLKLGQTDDAEVAFGSTLALSPNHEDARGNLIKLLNLNDRPVEAEVVARDGFNLAPEDPARIALLAQQLRRVERYDEALNYFEMVLARRPTDQTAALAYGATLTDLDRPAEAIRYFTALLENGGDPARCNYNIGLAQKLIGDIEASINAFDDAIEANPSWPNPRYSRGLAHLALQNFELGLPDYEMRWGAWEGESIPPDFPHPAWQGQPISGEKLLVWAEQGVGDHILYAGLLSRLLTTGAHCTVECDPRLMTLFARSFPDITFAGAETPPSEALRQSDFAYQVGMGSLMYRLGITGGEFLAPRRFLVADPERRSEIAGRLDRIGRQPRIGISWRSARVKHGPRKSLPLADWAPILSGRDATFVNLQYGDTDVEIAAATSATGSEIYTDPEIDRFNDLEGLAALIDGLDLVITTSNATAHFAGALGKETWLLVGATPLWYWGHAGEATIFYPSVTAFRQAVADDWQATISTISSRLDSWQRDDQA